MLNGIALESFKRGLTDDLLYAVSVQEPLTLDNAITIAQRIERDMIGSADRKTNINYSAPTDEKTPKIVQFKDEEQKYEPPFWVIKLIETILIIAQILETGHKILREKRVILTGIVPLVTQIKEI